MSRSIVAAGTLRSGQIVCVATERSHNTVYALDGRRWEQLVRWPGTEVTAACACGDTIVCAALDDVVYLVRGTTVTRAALPDGSDWVYGAAALSDDEALLGGAGLFVLSVADGTVTRRRLSEFGISRPGRQVLGVVRTGGRTLVLGKKNLLVEFRGDSAAELVPAKALAGRELFFRAAVDVDGVLWLAGTGPRAFLARHEGDTVRAEEIPVDGQSAPVLAGLGGGELLLGAERLFAGRPGGWRELLAGPVPSGPVVATTPCPDGARVCVVSAGGSSFLTDGRSCEEIRVF